MANYDSNYAIAQEISARIGNSPIPFDSVYSICLEIYNELGGEPAQFDSVYEILLGILPLVEGGIATKVIDDTSIRLDKTWSSSKINEEIQAVAGTANSEIEGKETEDFTFVTELPASGEEDEQVIIKGENADTLYKYVSGSWVEQTPDATKLYFDTETEALYSYVSADHQFAPVSLVNTIIVGSNLNTNTALKAIKTPGVYSVVQRLHSSTKGDYIKNWTLTVEGIDYDEYERTDSIYQRIQSNYTIQKRTWSSTRATNDGWSNFSTYYAGEIKDSTTSKYYTWSSNKLTTELGAKQDTLTAGTNIDITNNTVSAKGYTYDDTIGSIKQHNVAYGDNPSTEDNNIATGTNCAVFGQGNTASSKCTFVAGESNSASSSYAVAVGYGNTVSKMAGVAFGRENTVAGQGGFAEGYKNNVTAQYAHAEGRETTAAGLGSHVEGYNTSATAQASHAEGQSTSATSTGAHAEGETTQATGIAAHAEGFGSPTYGANVASGNGSHVEGIVTIAQNFGEHAEGCSNISHKASDTYGDLGNTQHSVGIGEAATKKNALEIMQNGDHYIYGIGGYVGTDTKVQNASIKTLQEVVNGKQDVLTAGQNISIDASNNISAEGYIFDASKGSFAEQYFDDDNNVIATNIATGIGSHAGGCGNTASGNYGSHAEGYGNTASGECSHAEGFNNTASGNYGSHAEGYGNTASSDCAHAEGGNNVASSYYAHAEGQNNTASGNSSHTEGAYNTASGTTSHAEGWYTIALNQTEHAEGQTNLSHKASDNYGNAGNTQHSVGIGVSPNRKNAFEIMQNGDMYVYGIGGYVGTNTTVQDSTIKTLQEYIASLEARIATLEGNTTVE